MSLRAEDCGTVTGTVAWCRKGLAGINLDHALVSEDPAKLRADNDPDRRRSNPRVDVAARIRLKAHGRTIEGRLNHISAKGAGVIVTKPVKAGAPILMTLPDLGDLRGFVCWSKAKEAGLRFDAPIPVDALANWLGQRTRVSYQN